MTEMIVYGLYEIITILKITIWPRLAMVLWPTTCEEVGMLSLTINTEVTYSQRIKLF